MPIHVCPCLAQRPTGQGREGGGDLENAWTGIHPVVLPMVPQTPHVKTTLGVESPVFLSVCPARACPRPNTVSYNPNKPISVRPYQGRTAWPSVCKAAGQ